MKASDGNVTAATIGKGQRDARAGRSGIGQAAQSLDLGDCAYAELEPDGPASAAGEVTKGVRPIRLQ